MKGCALTGGGRLLCTDIQPIAAPGGRSELHCSFTVQAHSLTPATRRPVAGHAVPRPPLGLSQDPHGACGVCAALPWQRHVRSPVAPHLYNRRSHCTAYSVHSRTLDTCTTQGNTVSTCSQQSPEGWGLWMQPPDHVGRSVGDPAAQQASGGLGVGGWGLGGRGTLGHGSKIGVSSSLVLEGVRALEPPESRQGAIPPLPPPPLRHGRPCRPHRLQKDKRSWSWKSLKRGLCDPHLVQREGGVRAIWGLRDCLCPSAGVCRCAAGVGLGSTAVICRWSAPGHTASDLEPALQSPDHSVVLCLGPLRTLCGAADHTKPHPEAPSPWGMEEGGNRQVLLLRSLLMPRHCTTAAADRKFSVAQFLFGFPIFQSAFPSEICVPSVFLQKLVFWSADGCRGGAVVLQCPAAQRGSPVPAMEGAGHCLSQHVAVCWPPVPANVP